MIQRFVSLLVSAALLAVPAGAAYAAEASEPAAAPEVAQSADTSQPAEASRSDKPAFSVIEGGAAAVPGEAAAQEGADGLDVAQIAAQSFPSWNPDSASLAALIAYVDAATDESDPGFVPVEDRIAVFDMDGTFIGEKAPIYVDQCLLMHRGLEDPSFVASDDVRTVCEAMRELADEGRRPKSEDLPITKDAAFAQVFAGMTLDEFRAYVNEFLDTQEVEGFSGMTYGETFYRPMVEVIDYLRANDFTVYVVSACEREVVRAMVEDRLGIDYDHVLGSDLGLVATGQGDEPGLDYTFDQSDKLVLDGTYLLETGKTNKVIAIGFEIGKRPVLAFGNSSGDFAMLNYATANDKYPGMGFLVVADDEVREYGNAEAAEEMYARVAEEGWTAFSMRDDWATIYGEGVEKTCLRADEELAEAA